MVIPLTLVRESLAMGRCHNFQFYMTSIKYFVLLYIACVNSSWKRLKSAESSYKLQTEFVLCSEYFLCALQLPSLLFLFIRQKLWEDRDFFSHITGWLHGPSCLLLSVSVMLPFELCFVAFPLSHGKQREKTEEIAADWSSSKWDCLYCQYLHKVNWFLFDTLH